MDPIRRAGQPRIPTWIVACLAVALSVAAALAYLAYMSNRIAAGAIIGLPGREADVALMQHHAGVSLVISALFQAGVVIVLFSLLRFGAEADRLVRWTARGAVATFLSFVITLGIGVIMFETLNLLRMHLR